MDHGEFADILAINLGVLPTCPVCGEVLDEFAQLVNLDGEEGVEICLNCYEKGQEHD